LVGDNPVHAYVVYFFGQVGGEAFFEAQADTKGLHLRGSEESVIKPSASSEASAVVGESDAWHENEVHIFQGDSRAVGLREEEAMGAGQQVMRGEGEGEGG